MAVINIGNKIKSILDKKGMTASEFAMRINKSRENVYSIFKRKSIDTALLLKISEVLEHDFFQHYTNINTKLSELQEENDNLKEMVKFFKSKKNK